MTTAGSPANGPTTSENAKGETASRLQRIADFLNSDGASKSLTSLLDTCRQTGRSKGEVKKLLDDLDAADKDRQEKIAKIQSAMARDRERIRHNKNLLRRSEEIEARLREQIAHLDVRLAERSRARAELKKRGRARRKRIDDLLAELDIG